MTNWPTAPLIRITNGTRNNKDISNSTATLVDLDDPKFGYSLIDGPYAGFTVAPDVIGDKIISWENATAVPDEVIDNIHAAFYDTNMNEQQREAFQTLETYTF